MIGNLNRNETQYQMSDYLFCEVVNYLQVNNVKFSEFCKALKLPKYYLRKIMDRDIKMNTFKDLYIKIANYCNIPSDSTHLLYLPQPTRTK